jgi:flagellar biosynthesis chaperone FliJ
MPTVNIPNVGVVNFPDSMSPDEISAQASKLASPRAPGNLPSGAVSQQARKNLANNLPQVGADQQAQIMQDAQRKEAIRAAEILPFALAAPFTGGTSLAAGAGIMAGAGVAGGLGREAINATQGGETKSLGGLAASLGIDAATGAAGELGARGVVKGIGYVGKTLWPKIAVNAFGQSEKGASMLNDAFASTRQALKQEVGSTSVDISGPLQKLYGTLESIHPEGAGAIGEQFSGLSPRAATVASKIAQSNAAEARVAGLTQQIASKQQEIASAELAVQNATRRYQALQSGAGEAGNLGEQIASKQGEVAASEAATRGVSRQYGGATTGRAAKELEAAQAAADQSRRELVALHQDLSNVKTAAASNVVRARGITEEGRAAVKDLESQLKTSQDQIGSHQDLDSLIDQKGNFSRFAWKQTGLSAEEKMAFKRYTGELDSTIKTQLANNPKAMALYEQANQLGIVARDRELATNLASDQVGKYLSNKAVAGAVGSLIGGPHGAALGVVGAAGFDALKQKVGVVLLRRVLANPESAQIFRGALKSAAEGQTASAAAQTAEAFKRSGNLRAAYEIIQSFNEQQPAQPPPLSSLAPQGAP